MSQSVAVRIQVHGHLSADTAEWLRPLVPEHLPCGDTLISGTVADQTAFHGICSRLRDLNLILVTLTATRKDAS